MTLRLALDTATRTASVAVGDENGLRAATAVGDRRGAAALVPAVEACLDLAGATHADLGGIVLADGPGSFTGLRIGFATAQGLARPGDLDVVLVPALMVEAWGAATGLDEPVVAVFDALRGDVFAAAYRFGDDSVATVLPPTRVAATDLPNRIDPVPVVVTGDVAALDAGRMLAWTGRRPVPRAAGGRAGAALDLVRRYGVGTPVRDVATVSPTYGRHAEAQARWEREHGRPLPHATD